MLPKTNFPLILAPHSHNSTSFGKVKSRGPGIPHEGPADDTALHVSLLKCITPRLPPHGIRFLPVRLPPGGMYPGRLSGATMPDARATQIGYSHGK